MHSDDFQRKRASKLSMEHCQTYKNNHSSSKSLQDLDKISGNSTVRTRYTNRNPNPKRKHRQRSLVLFLKDKVICPHNETNLFDNPAMNH